MGVSEDARNGECTTWGLLTCLACLSVNFFHDQGLIYSDAYVQFREIYALYPYCPHH